MELLEKIKIIPVVLSPILKKIISDLEKIANIPTSSLVNLINLAQSMCEKISFKQEIQNIENILNAVDILLSQLSPLSPVRKDIQFLIHFLEHIQSTDENVPERNGVSH